MINRFFLLGLALLGLTLSSCGELPLKQQSPQSELYRQYQEGLGLFRARKYDQALRLFLTLQSKHPDKLDLMYNIGAVYLQLGSSLAPKDPNRKKYLDKAEHYLKQVLEKGSANLQERAHYNLGVLYARKNQYESSYYHFETAASIARKTLKRPDKDAEKNSSLIAALIRERNRRRRQLNRTRVFRYEPKIFTLFASKVYRYPAQKIALKGIFTYKKTGKTQVVWGYPAGGKKWQLRFIPNRSGKWSYKIETVVRDVPATKGKTVIDRALHDSGLFKVLPSARPGKLVLSGANKIRLAWKKKKQKITIKKKKKSKKNKKIALKKKAKAKKKPKFPKDERMIRWQGIFIKGLFDELSEKSFQKHLVFLETFEPSAIHLSIDLAGLFSWDKKGHLSIDEGKFERLTKRLKALRRNPIHHWVFVYELRASRQIPQIHLTSILNLLIARLAHVDVVWSLEHLPVSLELKVRRYLLKNDPYRQPIALRRPFTQSNITKKGKKKSPRRFLVHSDYFVALGPILRKKLQTPWIVDLPLPIGLSQKALLAQWWKLYVSGYSTSVRLNRPFHDDELKTIQKWLIRALEEDKLPPHPDTLRKKQKQKKKKLPKIAQKNIQKKKLKHTKLAPKNNSQNAKVAQKNIQKGKKKEKKEKKEKKTPFKMRLSRPFLRYAIVRHHWVKFLDSFRFSAFVKPDMVRVKIPDFSGKNDAKASQDAAQRDLKLALSHALKIKDKKERQKAIALALKRFREAQRRKLPSSSPSSQPTTKLTLAKKATSRPSSPLSLKARQPKWRWKEVSMRGFIASNGLTTIFLLPKQMKKTPKIHWKRSRWDLEFTWYNALTGKFLKKRLLRQVTSLELTRPKETAHVAKVMVQDHPLFAPYIVPVPPQFVGKKKRGWYLKGWTLVVQPPKGARQLLRVLLTSNGYSARFRPDSPGIWSFYLLRNNKRLKGEWGYDGKIKVVPGRYPAPLHLNPRKPRHLFALQRPFFFFIKPIKGLLSSHWSERDFGNTLKALQERYVGASLFATSLPKIPWRATIPQKAKNWSSAIHAPLDRLDQRISSFFKKGLRLALTIPFERWRGLTLAQRQKRLFYLLDRYAAIYPIVWFLDIRKTPKVKTKELLWFAQNVQMWFKLRYPTPLPKKVKGGRKSRPSKAKVIAYPPLIGILVGKPHSEKQLQELSKISHLLWLSVDELLKAVQDFKLDRLPRPIVLTWGKLAQERRHLNERKKGKASLALQRWTRFLWRAHLLAFHNAGTTIAKPLILTKKKEIPLTPQERVVMTMRAFFQSFDWSKLMPITRSVKLKSYQAFGGETPFSKKSKKAHHIVIWVNRTVRRHLELQRLVPLKKHRYIWLDPLSGKRPIGAQLLPPLPDKKRPDKMQLPFRPAVLYIFRRPPRKRRSQKNRRQRRRRQRKNRSLSRRQRIRNRLRQLRENRNDLLRKMLKKQKPKSLSGKRG